MLTDEYNPLIEAIRSLPKPVVAAVNGVAAGAGVSLALAADLVVAAEEARFVPAFDRIGLVPDSGLARDAGAGAGPASRLRDPDRGARSSRRRGPRRSASSPRSCPATRWPRAVRELAQRWPRARRAAIGLTKRLLNAAEDATLAESLEAEAALQELAGRTEDHAEGVAAFAEKRDPRFRRPMSEIHTVGVLGAGTMGAGIAQVAAEAGLDVLLHDPVDGRHRAGSRAHRRLPGPQGGEGPARRERRRPSARPHLARPTASRRWPRPTW